MRLRSVSESRFYGHIVQHSLVGQGAIMHTKDIQHLEYVAQGVKSSHRAIRICLKDGNCTFQITLEKGHR